MDVTIERAGGPGPGSRPVEVVERKGLGHPDTICDALAERFSVALARYYLDRFGRVLHHNVDKVLLCGGQADVQYGGGRMLRPIEIYFSGRATLGVEDERVPVDALLDQAARRWLIEHIHGLDSRRDVTLHCLVKPGSEELRELFARTEGDEEPLANDTSLGVGFAPFTALETLVLQLETAINSPHTRACHPEIGEDVKIMAVRRGEAVTVTVACAFVSRFVHSRQDYLEKKRALESRIRDLAKARTTKDVDVVVNAADDAGSGSVYLTVTGTSAEAGDDGEAGRGNRVTGLITPYRPMTLEATAGKNPRSHTGKLYQVAAQRIAERIVSEVAGVAEAETCLVSRIGRPISEPALVDIALRLRDGADFASCREGAARVVTRGLQSITSLWREILCGRVRLY